MVILIELHLCVFLKSIPSRSLFFIVFFCVGIFNSSLLAQLCTGSLGDPVVKIDFGNGAASYSFTAPGYRLTTGSCPNDGEYSITTFQSNCGRQWHSVSADHTGGGAFMMVNASNTPGDFFLQTVTNLCPNTTYEFSAWVLNVVSNPALIKPNLTFKVESITGALLNQYSTGDIGVFSQPIWEPFGFYFTTGAGTTTVVLRITNNAPGGGGNDLALDDIQFRPCGPTLRSAASGGMDTVRVCEDIQIPVLYQGNLSTGFTLPAYQWQVSTDTARTWNDIPGANTLQYLRTPSVPGHFLYRLTVAENGSLGISSCRIASNILLADIYPKPAISAGPDRTKFAGRPVQLLGTSDGAANNQFEWAPPLYLSDATIAAPLADPPQLQSYVLKVTNSRGCISRDTVSVNVIDKLYVPTAFTPNGDGKNDRWSIPNLDLADGALVQVFDRAGQVVFNAANSSASWDGNYQGLPLPTGVYIYLIRFRDGFIMKGQLTLISK